MTKKFSLLVIYTENKLNTPIKNKAGEKDKWK